MKPTRVLLILVFFCTTLQAKKYKYWAETTAVDQFILIENGVKREIKSGRVDKDQFIFSTNSPSTLIQMKCSICRDSVSIKLFGEKEDAYTEQIYIKHKDGISNTISLQDCFKKKEKIKLVKVFKSLSSALHDFLRSARFGRIKSVSGLKGQDDESSQKPILFFKESDGSYYIDRESFEVTFELFDEAEIKSIYIISHSGNLIFLSGDPSLVGSVVDASNRTIPPLKEVLKKDSDSGKKSYKINWGLISKYVHPILKLDEKYQLGVELEGDSSDYNPYQYNFQIDSKLEELIQKFSGGN